MFRFTGRAHLVASAGRLCVAVSHCACQIFAAESSLLLVTMDAMGSDGVPVVMLRRRGSLSSL